MTGVDNLELVVPGGPPPSPQGAGGMSRRRGLFDRAILAQAAIDALKKFDPRVQVRNPVMFVVLLGTVVTFLESIAHPSRFDWLITIWLALTVFFANSAEVVAEGRGKAQADSLRRLRVETDSRRQRPDGSEDRVAAADLVRDDLVVCEAGDGWDCGTIAGLTNLRS